MKWIQKYYENRRHFLCPECHTYFTLSLWKWLCAPHLDMWLYRRVKCPYCGARHWLKAEKVVE